MQVEIWSDVVCPWCYLGKRRFERALDGFEGRDEVEVTYRSFELDPTAPPGVTEPTATRLADKYGMTEAQATQAQQEMEQRAAQDGLEFHLDASRSGNTRDAHRLLHLAHQQGQQAELAEALHRAYFTERRSVFDAASLAAVAESSGLAPDQVQDVLESDRYLDAVIDDERLAQQLGITGVPFFVFDRRLAVSGAQSEEVLGQALRQAWQEAVAS